MIEHFEKIHGFFCWYRLYKDVVRKFPSGSLLVEVGCYKGKSLFYLLMQMEEAGKDFDVIGVDNFCGVDGYESAGVDLRLEFDANMSPLAGKYGLIEDISWEAPKRFADRSIDFVFIDASHDYDSVKKDILAWLPKVKKGGVISGHDYHIGFKGVDEAVDEIFGKDNIKGYVDEQCWYYNV